MIAKRAPIIIFTLVCLLGTSALSQNGIPAQKPRRLTLNDLPRLLTFNDLKRNDGVEGPFRIEDAFVIEIHKCPPCPPGAQCKPCLGDYVVVTDNLDEKDPLLIKRVKVFTGRPERLEWFKLKKKCSFVARVRGKVPSGKPIEDLELIDRLYEL